ncbi:MAG TPA: hypothetical protein VFJ98_04640 [Mycobacteriales bacterium]|nr:hypothetical protein [Mycobacteriales bacterium]
MRVLAHAFGERYDLPIPLYLFVLGGALVVVVSFALVARREHAGGRPADAEVADGAHVGTYHPVAGWLSVLVLALLAWCGLAGSQEVSENLLPTVFWLVVWVAAPLAVALLGDWTRPVNPFAFLARVCDSSRARDTLLGGPAPVSWPDRLGWWPAAALFFAAACAELMFNLTTTLPHVIAWMLLLYAAMSALGGLVFGEAWLRRGEMFTVLFDTWGRLGWFRFGAPGRRGFAGGLEHGFSAHASRIVFVLLMLLNVNFDGLLSTPQWQNDVLRELPGSYGEPGNAQHWFNVGAFVLMTVLLLTLLTGFAVGSARAGEHRTRWTASLAGLLPSLLPIAFGYLVSHYLSYLLVNGQLLFPLIGNPTGLESWPISLPYPFNDDYDPDPNLLPGSFYWYVAVVVIVAVHIAAVLLANRHLAAVARNERVARRGEYPWLLAMVGYTCLSLWLLAQPFTETSATTTGSGSEAHGPPPPAVTLLR